MRVHVRVTPEAEADIDEALSWYDQIHPELGERFISDLRAVVDQVRQHPTAFRAAHGSIRRALLRHFPYCVFYVEDADLVTLIGCLHARRDPSVWKIRGRRYR